MQNSNRSFSNYGPKGSASKRESRRTKNLISELEKESDNNAELLRYDIDDFDNELNDFL